MQQQETSDSIEVLIRIRPFSEREKQEEARSCFKIDGHSKNTIIFDATTKSETKYFTFDHVCTEQISQEEIFRIIGIPTATSCLQGYNGCIFAYGQTGAGKTYTIQGPGLDISFNNSLNPEENEKRGILPRVVEYMFSSIESAHDTSSNIVYSVKCNFLEIYNEHIIDLLSPSARNLQIREDIKKGIYIEGLTEEKCTNAFDTLEIVKKGNRSRHIGATNMNIESSRSHSVFTFVIEAKVAKDGITNIRRSRFSFVDLAGSERQKMASTVGDRLKEGCLINKSLMVLANVINSLVDISEGKSRFVHYRDSKLTFLLKDSLGGNSKTSIIANISPAFSSYGETLSTIKFAQRAKLIKNKVHINEDTSGTLESLKSEILRLRQELANMRNLINIGGIRYSDEKRTLRKSSLELGPIPEFDTNLMQEDMPWSTEEEIEPRESQKSHDLEVLLKQSLDILTESETHLLNELSKKDDIIERLKSRRDIANDAEMNMKMVVRLLTDKVDRFKAILEKKILSKEDCIDIINDEERNELKARLLEVLRESHGDSFIDQSKEINELKEENNRLREEYVHLMDILTKQEDQITKICVEHQNKMELEEKISNEKKIPQSEELAKMKEEYEQMIQEYEKVIYEMEAKNSETIVLKEILEKHEMEKKLIAEEIDSLSKAFEEKTKLEYDEKLKAFVFEQEKVLEQFKSDFLQVKNEMDILQNESILLRDQVKGFEGKCQDLIVERESLLNKIEYHKDLEIKLNQESLDINKKLADFIKQNNQSQSEVKSLTNFISKLQEDLNLTEDQNNKLKEENNQRLIEFENITRIVEEKSKVCEEMRKNYEKSEEACFDKDIEIGELKDLYNTLQNNFKGKVNELNTIQNVYGNLEKEIESQKKEALSLEEKLEYIQSKYNLKVQELEEIKKQYENLQNDHILKEKDLVSFNEVVENLNNQIQIKDLEITSLSDECKRLIDLGESAIAQRESLKETNEKLNYERSQKDDEINQIKEEKNKLQEINASQTRDLEALKSENSDITQEYNQLKAEKQILNEEYERKMEEIEKINDQIKALGDALQEKEHRIFEWTANYEELKVQLDLRENEFDKVNENKITLQSKLEEKIQEFGQLVLKYKDLENEYNNKTSQFEEMTKNFETVNKKLANKDYELLSLKEQYERQQEKCSKVEQEFSNLRAENEVLKQENQNSQLENKNLKLIQQELQNSLLLYKESLDSSLKECDGLKSNYLVKEEEYTTLKQEYQSKIDSLKEKEYDINDLQQSYKTLKNNVDNLENKYQTLKQERDHVLNQYEQVLEVKSSHENEIGNLRKLIDDFESEKGKLLKEAEEAKQNEKKLKEEMKKYMQTVGKLKLDYEKVNNEVLNNEEQITKLNEEIRNLHKDMNEMQEEMNQNESKGKQIEDNLKFKEKEIEELQNQIAVYEQEQIRFETEYEAFIAERNMFEKMEESLREQVRQLSLRSEKLIEEHDQNRNRFKNEKMVVEKENNKLNECLLVREEEITQLNEKLENFKKEKDSLSKQLKEKAIKESTLLEEKELVLEDLNKVKQYWRQIVHDLETENLELSKKTETLMEEINSKKDLINSLKDQYESLIENKGVAENAVEELSIELQQANTSIRKFEMINIDYEKRQITMKEEYDRLNQETESLKNELKEKNEELLQMRENQNNLASQLEQLSSESEFYKEQVTKLEKELKEEIAKMYEQREKDLNEVTEQYLRLTQEHKTVIKNISIKEEQLMRIKEELHMVLGEKEKMHQELQTLKAVEAKLRQDNQEQSDKIIRLNSDQYLLLKEIDALNQANDTLGGHNNMGQKIRHLNKLKEENNKLKFEKVRAVDDLTKAVEQRDKLQKKLDEMQGKLERDSKGFFESNRETLNNSRFEQERKSLHNQQSMSLTDNLSRISSLIHSNLGKEDAKYVNTKSNDIESVLNAVQALTMLIMEKNKMIHGKETELESVVLKNSILEKELLLMKQKMYLPHPNPATSTSMSSLGALNEINNSKRLQQSPLEIRERARLPFSNKSIGDSNTFQKAMEQKLNNIVNNRSTSLKKGELKLTNDENSFINSFDFPPKANKSSVKKNVFK